MPRKKTIPVILIDRREQLPYTFSDYNIKTMPATLETGDYSIALEKGDKLTRFDHLISIERKTGDNFVGDIADDDNRARFEASVERGSRLEYYAVYIEASELSVLQHQYESHINPKSVINTAIGWSVKYGVPIEFLDNRFNAEYHTYTALTLFLKYLKQKSAPTKPQINNQIEHPTPINNIGGFAET